MMAVISNAIPASFFELPLREVYLSSEATKKAAREIRKAKITEEIYNSIVL